ncbi:MAG: 16S rRNA (uracil(1498)-N(3))-methyltransferase [Candidatus Limnocylindria bacterium]
MDIARVRRALMHRFFVAAGAVEGERGRIVGEQARQVATVLRLGAGEHVVLVQDGEEVEIALEHVARTEAWGRVMSRRRAETEPRIALTVALPLLKGDHSEQALAAAVQLGASRVVPFSSARSVVRELPPARRTRLERIARESAEVARRGRVPEIGPALEWADLLPALDPPVLVAWEEARTPLLRDALPRGDRLSLVVGPEGGLGQDEVDLARRQGAQVVSLGRRVLRAEVAVVAAVAQLVGALDR